MAGPLEQSRQCCPSWCLLQKFSQHEPPLFRSSPGRDECSDAVRRAVSVAGNERRLAGHDLQQWLAPAAGRGDFQGRQQPVLLSGQLRALGIQQEIVCRHRPPAHQVAAGSQRGGIGTTTQYRQLNHALACHDTGGRR